MLVDCSDIFCGIFCDKTALAALALLGANVLHTTSREISTFHPDIGRIMFIGCSCNGLSIINGIALCKHVLFSTISRLALAPPTKLSWKCLNWKSWCSNVDRLTFEAIQKSVYFELSCKLKES
jgi:hypothetical protein